MRGLKRFLTSLLNVPSLPFAGLVFAMQSGAVRGAEAVVYVSPDGKESGSGTAQEPFRRIADAVQNMTADVHTVEIAEGVYSVASGDIFPINVKVDLGQRIILRGPSSGKAIVRGVADKPIIVATVREGDPSRRSELSIESLDFEDGVAGLVVESEPRTDFTLSVRKCAFAGQGYQGLAASVGEDGKATFVVEGNEFDGRPLFSLDLVAGRRSSMQLQVEANTVVNNDPVTSFSTPPRAGIAVHAEEGGRVYGIVDRNILRNVSNCILVTQMSPRTERATVDLRISNCLVAGNPDPAGNRLVNGCYFLLWPINESRLQLINNTVAHARGHAILRTGGSPVGKTWDGTSLSLIRSIVWDVARGGFSDEQGGALPSFYTEIRNNVLSASALVGTAGNVSSDPLWGADFEPGKESPAVDADFGPIPQEFATDAMGRCRVADGNGDGVSRIDLGAIERVGPCYGDVVFLRGDCDSSRVMDLTDAISHLDYLFLGGLAPDCPDACDSNDDGELDIADPIYSLGFMFTGGKPPPVPYPLSGEDRTEDRLLLCRKSP